MQCFYVKTNFCRAHCFFVLIHNFTRGLYKYDFQVVSKPPVQVDYKMSFFILLESVNMNSAIISLLELIDKATERGLYFCLCNADFHVRNTCQLKSISECISTGCMTYFGELSMFFFFIRHVCSDCTSCA